MAKTCPGCGYQPIGPFTDNCPICAEPVRNVRSGTGSAGSLGRSSLVRWLVGGALVVALGVAGCCGLGAWRLNLAVKDAQEAAEQARANAEADRRARTVVVGAAQMLQEFENATEADQKYRGKCLELSGVVERVGRDRNEMLFIILHAGDESAKLKIECFFDPADRPDEVRIEQLVKGQAVTVRGEYGGRVSHVQLQDCVLVK